jgi:hypothetical protein
MVPLAHSPFEGSMFVSVSAQDDERQVGWQFQSHLQWLYGFEAGTQIVRAW